MYRFSRQRCNDHTRTLFRQLSNYRWGFKSQQLALSSFAKSCNSARVGNHSRSVQLFEICNAPFPIDFCTPLRSFSTRHVTDNRPLKGTVVDIGNAKKITKRIVEFGKNGNWSGILDLHDRFGDCFTSVNYSTAMNHLGKQKLLFKTDSRLNEMLLRITMSLENDASSWNIVSKVVTLHAIAKMRLESDIAKKLVNIILNDSSTIVKEGNAISTANAAWAVATMKIPCPDLFREIEIQANFLVTNGNPQTIANTAWACATQGEKCVNLFNAIDDSAEYIVQEGKTQAVANTIWAFATLKIQCPHLIQMVDNNATRILSGGRPQHVANIAWALATLDSSYTNFLHTIDKDPFCVVTPDDPQASANTAWAFATLQYDGQNFFKTVDSNAVHFVKRGKPLEIANIMHAFASLNIQCPHTCLMIEANVDSLLSNSVARNLATIIWSFATLGVVCPSLCRAVNDNAKWLIDTGSAQTISNTIWAMGVLGFDCADLLNAIENASKEIIHNCNDQEIINICYAFCVLDAFSQRKCFKRLWRRALSTKWASLENRGRIQLVQCYMIFSLHMEVPSPDWSHSVLEVDSSISASQQEMSEILRELNLEHDVEASPFPNDSLFKGVPLLCIDAALYDHKIAFEFDGPSHFLRIPGSRKLPYLSNGPTKCKQRFLTQLGWTVVSIPYFEWSQACSRASKKEMLADKLEQLGLSV